MKRLHQFGSCKGSNLYHLPIGDLESPVNVDYRLLCELWIFLWWKLSQEYTSQPWRAEVFVWICLLGLYFFSCSFSRKSVLFLSKEMQMQQLQFFPFPSCLLQFHQGVSSVRHAPPLTSCKPRLKAQLTHAAYSSPAHLLTFWFYVCVCACIRACVWVCVCRTLMFHPAVLFLQCNCFLMTGFNISLDCKLKYCLYGYLSIFVKICCCKALSPVCFCERWHFYK